jgi:mannosyltransferase
MIFFDGIVYSLQKKGGISEYFNNIISGLQNHNKIVGLYRNNYFNINKINVEFYSNQLFREFRSVENIAYSNIFHSTYYRLPNKKFTGAIITTVHDFIHERYINSFAKYKHIYLKKLAIKNSDHLICVSKNTKDDLLYYYPSLIEKNISVIYHGVSEDFFKMNPLNFNHGNYVLFVGNRASYKNFDLCVKAVSILPKSINLFIVGSISLNKFELELLIKYKLEKRFKFFNNISNHDLNLLYNNALVLLYLSSYEGFGLPVLEAMRAGCPVICSDKSSIKEITLGSQVVFADYDPIDISNKIYKLLASDTRKSVILKNIIFSNLYSWSTSVKQHSNIYNQFI